MKKIVIVLTILLPFAAVAQKKEFCNCQWNTIISTGLLGGETTIKPLFQTSSGLSFRGFYTGIGLGIDAYRFKSIPLFADLRWAWGKSKRGFLYAHTGYHFPVDNEAEFSDQWSGKTSDDFKGGLYMDAGAGYRIRTGKWKRLLLSAGYSHKQLTNKVGYTSPCLVPPCPEFFYTYKYDLGRVTAKLSWLIGRTK